MPEALKPSDISKPSKRLAHITAEELPPLPPPYEDFNKKTIAELKEEKVANVEASLDDTIAIGIPKPKNKEEEEELYPGVSFGITEAVSEGKQLGIPSAASPFHGPLRQMPDLFRVLPGFRNQRAQGNLSPELSVRSPAADLPEICQTLRETLGQAYRRYRFELDDDLPGWPS